MDRRRFIRTCGSLGTSLLAASPLALLGGCTPSRGLQRLSGFAPDTSFGSGACGIPPVLVAPEREIRTVVGLRPFRPSGFVVRAERLGDTLVVHNYGHGGGGIPLSWGTAKLAVDLGAPAHSGAVAVIGSGAVGLATARLLQEEGFDVTIYTKALPPETTSNIAGGQWFPFFVSDHDRRTPAFDRQFLAAAQYAYGRYQIMAGPKFGVRWMRNYFPRNAPPPEGGYASSDSPLRALMPEFRDLAPDEHPFGGYAYVRQFDTLIIEPPVYLAAMLDEFLIARGRIVVREMPDRAAIQALPEKLVFNCTGLGAKKLFDDEELVPVKGQLTFLLPQPEIQYATSPQYPAGLPGGKDVDLYMFPRSDGILLGGTHQRGEWSLEPDLEAKARVLAGHKAFFDRFKAC